VRRLLFEQDHDDFRSVVRDFIAREVQPLHDPWIKNGVIPRDLYRQLRDLGM
jgi:acyl-CoA dehydrogenase